MIKAHNEVNRKAVISGFKPTTNPIATPASDECERVSPIIEYLLRTKKSPINGQSIEIIKLAIKAFRINSDCNIETYLSV